jgi:hypothetical protein
MQWFIDNRPDFRESLQKFHDFLRDSFKVPFPTTAARLCAAGHDVVDFGTDELQPETTIPISSSRSGRRWRPAR